MYGLFVEGLGTCLRLLEAEMSFRNLVFQNENPQIIERHVCNMASCKLGIQSKHSIPCQSWVMVSFFFLMFTPSLGKIPILINIFIDGLKPPTSKVSEYSYFAQGCPITASECFFGEGPV